MDDHDLWMAFFEDPDGHTLAVMQERKRLRAGRVNRHPNIENAQADRLC
jgi:hypothetical protein